MPSNLDDENLDEATSEWLKTMPDNKVIEWLGNDLNGVPNYLHLLNLNWSPKGVDSDLKLINEVARKLADEPNYLRQMIRTVFWRHTLVACVSVILLEAKQYCADLEDSFMQPNFVSPQIAVALGLLCPNQAISCLGEVVRGARRIPEPENYKRELTIYSYPKAICAAQAVISILEPKLALELVKSDTFQHHKNHPDGQTGADVAEHHWEFWSGVIQKRI
jgi:hypothetical protein